MEQANTVTLITGDNKTIQVSQNIVDKIAIVKNEINGYSDTIDEVFVPRIKNVSTLQTVIAVLDEIYTQSPILKIDATFFQSTDQHSSHTSYDIPQQVREIVSEKVNDANYDTFIRAVEYLEIPGILRAIQNSTDKSVADLIAYGDVPEVKNNELSLRGLNIQGLAGMYLLIDKYHLGGLKRLDLSNNCIQGRALPVRVFSCLSNVAELDLSHNDIRGLSLGVFNGLKNLKILDLSHNKIKRRFLPTNLFATLRRLERLNVSNNNIRGFRPGVFRGLQSLKILDLQYNNIIGEELQPRLFSGFSTAVDLQLGGNAIDHATRYVLDKAIPSNVAVSFAKHKT
jgi:Leucine-rich repeat (LRR) protein